MFDYVATYMYEDDTPAAERRAQALSLDRELLRELLGQEELRDLLDPGALAEVEASLRPVPRNADELHDLLRRVGDLRDDELDAGFAETLVRERRAFRARLGGEDALVAAEDAGLYRDAFGVMPPAGCPSRSSSRATMPSTASCSGSHAAVAHSRRARSRRGTPSTPSSSRPRWPGSRRATSSFEVSSAPVASSGSGATRTSCVGSDVRRSPFSGARSSRPSRPRSDGSCPVGTGSTGARPCARRSSRSRAWRCRSSLWETEILPRRIPGYQAAWLDQLCATGEVVWIGAGLDRVALYYRDDVPLLGPPARGEPLAGEMHDAVRAVLGESAAFWPELLQRRASIGPTRSRCSGSSSGTGR